MSEKKKEKEDIKKTQKFLVKGMSGGLFGGAYPEYFEDLGKAEEFGRETSFVSGQETLIYQAVSVATPEIHKSTSLNKL
jgi:hypothetical protein